VDVAHHFHPEQLQPFVLPIGQSHQQTEPNRSIIVIQGATDQEPFALDFKLFGSNKKFIKCKAKNSERSP